MGGGRRSVAKELAWRELFATQTTTRMPVAEFCRDRGIAASGFYFWRKEIARRDAERNTAPQSSRPQVAKGVVDFAEVEVTKSKVSHDRDEYNGQPITIHVANDYRIEVPRDFDPHTLREILCVLRGESC